MNKKIVSAVFFIIIGAAVIFSGYFWFGNYYASWKIGRQYQKFERAFQNFLKEDTYGGATPEETYKMFLQALKAGDIESSSKYFYWEHQEQEKQKFQKMKDEGQLEGYISSLPDWGQLEEDHSYSVSGTKKYGWIEVSEKAVTVELPKGNGEFVEETILPGEYKQEMDFQLNNQANIWKIYSL